MMLELLLTRSEDRELVRAAQGLRFLVFDELHTYRGRQGADVAMLMRRVRDRLCREHEPICIGTSATMVSDGSDAERAAAVANVASRLFGATITADGVIDESLRRATDQSLTNSGCAVAWGEAESWCHMRRRNLRSQLGRNINKKFASHDD